MAKIGVAILGQGRSGWSIHARHLLGDERYRVHAVVDRRSERRERGASAFHCAAYADYEAIRGLPGVRLVVNALPSPYHYPVTKRLLGWGYDVLSEKPAAGTPEEVDDMEAAARESGRTLAFFQQSRFAPYFLKIRQVLDSGVLGRVAQISIAFDGFGRRWDWQTLQDMRGGSLYNTGPHPLDQALSLLGGDDMPGVFCKMDRVLTSGDAEDYVKILLTRPDKPLIDISISSCNAYPGATYHVQGTRGGLVSDTKSVKWRWFDPSDIPERPLIRTPLTTPEGEPAYCGETLPWREDAWEAGPGEDAFTSAVEALYGNLYRHLTEGEPLVVTNRQVRRQIAVIRECHRQNPLDRMV